MKTNYFEKIKTYLILACFLLPQKIFAADFDIDIPGMNLNESQRPDSHFMAVFQRLIDMLNMVLNLMLAAGLLTSIAAGIYTAVQYATTDSPPIRMKVKKDFMTIAATTAIIAGIRIILYLIIALLSLF